MGIDPQKRAVDKAFDKLPLAIQEYVHHQGDISSVSLQTALQKDAMYFLRWISAGQEGRMRDQKRIENGHHPDFRNYLKAKGVFPRCSHKIDFNKSSTRPTFKPISKAQVVDETPSPEVQVRELTPRLRTTIPPNPEPVPVAASAQVKEENKPLETNNKKQKVDVHVPPPAQEPARGNGFGILATIGLVAVLLLGAWILWKNPTLLTGAVSTPAPSPTATVPAVRTYAVGEKYTMGGVDYKVVAVDSNGQPSEVALWTDSDTHSTPDPLATAAPPTESMPPVGDVAACPSDAVILSQQLFGYDAALLRENNAPAEYCLFETNQSLPGQNTFALASCPDGYACEMDTVGPGGKLAYGPQNGPFVFEHASLRLVAAYPSWDPIHFPCTALGNSQSFVNDTAASSGWKVEPVGFTCEDALPPGTPPSSWTVNTCPPDGSAAEVAATLGGLPGEWSIGSDAKGTYWKRAANSPRATLMAPWGMLDVWNGQPPTLHFGPGEVSSKSHEATWHCLAQ